VLFLHFTATPFSLLAGTKSLTPALAQALGSSSGRLIATVTANREISTFHPITFDISRDAILIGSQDARVYAWDLKTKQRIAVSPPQPAGSIAKTAFETSAMFYGFHQVPCLRAFRNIMSS
jgi:hypothetical protein